MLLLTLLPLAGWAQTEIDVTVEPYDGQAVWCGGAPTVKKNWVIVSPTVDADVKEAIAGKLVAQTLDGKYGKGEHTYKLALKDFDDATVTSGGNTYVIHTSGTNTAILTIAKYTGDPVIDGSLLGYVNDELTYNTSAQALLSGGATATANLVEVPVIYTLNPNGEPLVTFDSYEKVKATNAGDYTVYYKVADTDDYAGTNWASIGTKNIAKAELDWSDQNVTPTAGSWTYDGEAHDRAIAPANPYDFATYQYALTESGEDQDWSTEIPTGTNYNERIVWWRVLESDNYKAKAPTQLTATFTKGTPVFTTAPTFAESRPYNGEELHQIVSVGETTLGAQPVFRRRTKGGNGQWGNWSDWKSDLGYFTRTAAGECQLQYTTRTTDNLNPAIAGPSYSDPVDVVISKADITTDDFTAPTAAALTYDGTDQALVEGAATTGIDGTFTYATSEDGETWSDFDAAVPTGKNAKPYYVKYKFTPTANYNAYEAVVENVAIAPLSIVDGEGNLATGFALSAQDMTDANASVYKGTAITPSVVLRYNGKAMNHSVLDGVGDYARSYNNNINASDEAEIIFTAKNNFEGEYTQKFTINKADIANLNVTLAQTEYPYSAAANEPGVTVKLGDYTFAAEDYAVEYINNTNAGTATVTVTPNVENFTAASTSVNFTINKAPLTVKVADAEKAYGSVDPTPAVESIDGFVGGQTAAVLPEGAYSINRADGADPATYAYNVVDNGLANCNYSFVNANPQGALTIKAATVIVRPTVVEGTYGDYTVPALDQSGFAFTAEGLKAGHTINALKFTVTNEQGEEQAFDTMLPAGTYTITPSNAGTTAGSYTFDYQTATLTIAKRDLTLTAVDQTIEYGSSANTAVAFEGVDKTVDVENRVGADDLGTITINVAAEATSIDTHVDAITLSVEGENANYNYTLVPGDLTITAPVAGITLDGSASIAQVISDYNGKKVNVKIDFSSRNGRNLGGDRKWGQYDWMTLTLPFDISVAELSQTLGYAIVNVIDDSKTVVSADQSKFYGKLTMTGGNGKNDVLAANKPFMVKTAGDIDGVIEFGQQTIVAPASAEDLTVDAGQGATFVGTYAPMTVTSADDAKKWFLIGGGYGQWAFIKSTSSATWNLMPTEAYIQLPIETQSIVFNFEDVNGTTAIKSIDVDNLSGKVSAEGWYTLNGMKLQTAPTEKGVYIKDGKKVVVK